jgi:wyosine [tRNA(Phe)-imidazoG37] synthetase (radical SAM superfamily)
LSTDSSINVIFGPVPSRRLGRSLGINNIPPKICSYACIYCQLGKAVKMRIRRQPFYEPDSIYHLVQGSVNRLRKLGETVDYLAFVSDGEPTLDRNLGTIIEMLKPLGIPVAVISNGSLITRQDVRTDLNSADWVSMKVDAVSENLWRIINRPHGNLELDQIQENLLAFRKDFKGTFTTETMLIQGINDTQTAFVETADFLRRLNPDIVYLSVPTRPPADQNVRPADPASIDSARQIFSASVKRVELLTGYEGNTFTTTSDIRRDVLSIAAVHPLRQDALYEMLDNAGASWQVIKEMLENQEIIQFEFQGNVFFLKNLSHRN